MVRAAANPSDTRPSDAVFDAVIAAQEGLRFGQLEMQLHDASVVAIMRSERMCLYECTRRAPDKGAR